MFSLLCWNIDGLDKQNTIVRAQAVCNIIAARKPNAVFLQEVVPSTQLEIVMRLGSDYEFFQAPNAEEKYGYFVTILVLKTEGLSCQGTAVCTDLPQTVMGRHLLTCTVVFYGVKINLSTSHLESMKDYGRPRKAQLSQVFEIMSNDSVSNWIFGGDLNIRDHEVRSVGVSDSIVDVWEATGSQEAHKFTWDTSENDNLDVPYKSKQRFDRVYLQTRDGRVRANSFSLLGKERLVDCGRFPSDHWGLWIDFNVQC